MALASALVRYPTVSTRQGRSGPAFATMAAFVQSWTAAHGLRFKVVGANDAWEISLGTGTRVLGLVTHADVIAAPENNATDSGPDPSPPAGWSYPPFAGTVADGRIYGRGSVDNKGPLAAALVALAALSGAHVPLRGEVAILVGLDAENERDGMERYVGTQPLAEQLVALDASFPVTIAENGFVAWHLAVADSPSSLVATRAVVTAAHAGDPELAMQVPGEAEMVLVPARHETVAQLYQRVQAALSQEDRARGVPSGFRATAAIEADGAHISVHAYGQASDTASAEQGRNALWLLAAIAHHLKVERQGFGSMLELIAQKLDGDLYGQKLGLAYSNAFMGKLVVAPTRLHGDDGQVVLDIAMHRPAGLTSSEFSAKLDAALLRLTRELGTKLGEPEPRYVGEPRQVAADTQLVQTLLDVYRRDTGVASAVPTSVRGSTCAHLFADAVSFGPCSSGTPCRAHGVDESIDISELTHLSRLLLAATVRLAAAPGSTSQLSGSVP